MPAETRALSKARDKLDRAQRRLATIRDEQQDAIESATRTAVTMGGAMGMAYWAGRYPDRAEILGIDASLVVGGSLTVAAMMEWAGDQTLIVESLGTGALAAYAASKGMEFGQEAAAEEGT